MSDELEVMHGSAVRLDPEWDRARQFLADGRRAARQLATEIERLRALYLRAGQGRRTDLEPLSQSVTKVEGGFSAKIQSELGLHRQQAARILESAAYLERIETITVSDVGTVLSWEDPKKGRQELLVTDRVRELAQQALAEQGQPGSPKPSRAWAGISGEGKRVGGSAEQGGSSDRQPVDHARNIARGLTALQTSLPHWPELSPRERAALEEGWQLIRALIPETWR